MKKFTLGAAALGLITVSALAAAQVANADDAAQTNPDVTSKSTYPYTVTMKWDAGDTKDKTEWPQKPYLGQVSCERGFWVQVDRYTIKNADDAKKVASFLDDGKLTNGEDHIDGLDNKWSYEWVDKKDCAKPGEEFPQTIVMEWDAGKVKDKTDWPQFPYYGQTSCERGYWIQTDPYKVKNQAELDRVNTFLDDGMLTWVNGAPEDKGIENDFGFHWVDKKDCSTPTPTPTPSETPTPSPTPTPSETPTPSPTPTPSETPTPSPTPTPSETPAPSPSPSETPSVTPTPSPSDTPRVPSPAPSTPAPSTPAPSVPAPSIPAPSVPAPSTPAPSVPAPSTSVTPSIPVPVNPPADVTPPVGLPSTGN